MKRIASWIASFWRLICWLDRWGALLPIIAFILVVLLLIALEMTTRTRPLALTLR